MYKKISEYDNVAYYDANTEHVVYYLQNDTKYHIWIDDLDLKFASNGYRVLFEVSYAFQNKKLLKDNKYTGISSSGVEIEMFVNNGVIKTAYPLILKQC